MNQFVVEVFEDDGWVIWYTSFDIMNCYQCIQKYLTGREWTIKGPDFYDSWDNYNGTNGNV